MSQSRSKGQALSQVRERLHLFQVPDLLLFTRDEWREDAESLLDSIQKHFGSRAVALRSSAANEDGESHARAGEYASVLNVSAANRSALRSAFSNVVSSYVTRGQCSSADEVIVQEMVVNTDVSGVIFTYEMNSGAPYYVVNYDDLSGRTDTVTSGSSGYSNRTLYVHRDSVDKVRSERFHRILCAIVELEAVVGSDTLDIEFALGDSLRPYLLQFRSITTRPNWNRALVRRIDAELDGVQAFVRERFGPAPGAFGTTTVFGQMPDWNPAEMIGRAPRALAMSLYERLITDRAWRVARETMGYAVPTAQPLMVSLAGQPYIDTRLSFHSFLPATLPTTIANKLVDTWVERLRDNPELHDKIEFDVAVTTYTFDLTRRIEVLCDSLDASERLTFANSVRKMTRPLIQGQGDGSIAAALKRVEWLAGCELPKRDSGPLGLMHLISDCVRYGTIPFAILARHGFIARSLLVSLVNCGVLDDADLARIQGGTRTVASELVEQIDLLQRGELATGDFMCRFGHLRPGTYDILSPRYSDLVSFGRDASLTDGPAAAGRAVDKFEPTAQQRRGIDQLLRQASFDDMDSAKLLTYLEDATAGREYGKFVFTRSVSTMLENIATFGERNGLSREEMSHISVADILAVGVRSGNGRSIEDRLREISVMNKERHAITSAIRLPQVLYDEASIRVVPFQVSQPNFITSRNVTAPTVYLSPYQLPQELTGCIVLVDNADPGYDWIFAHSISGLITKYGGANSHMAIRCAEFEIPAAIGCGEQRFDALREASSISLNCSVGVIDIMH